MSIIKNYRARKEAKRKRKVQEATKAYDTYGRKKDEDQYKVMGRQRREQAAYKRLGSERVISGRIGGGLAGGIALGAAAPLLYYSKRGRNLITKLPDKGRLGKLKASMLNDINTSNMGKRDLSALAGAYIGGVGGALGGTVSSIREMGRREKYSTNKKDKLIFRQNAAIKKYMKNRSSLGDDPYSIPRDVKLAIERDPAFIRTVMKQYDKKR